LYPDLQLRRIERHAADEGLAHDLVGGRHVGDADAEGLDLFDLGVPDQGRRTYLRRREINFNQGDKWKAAINAYIGTIPPNGDAICIAEQNMSGWPLL
jgi:hypothetical protein